MVLISSNNSADSTAPRIAGKSLVSYRSRPANRTGRPAGAEAALLSTHSRIESDSRMSHLKVFRPEEDAVGTSESTTGEAATPDSRNDASEPAIYSFVEWAERLRGPSPDAATLRAKRLHSADNCPSCRRVGILPLMLNDGRIDNSGRLVPGTATLVGFRCQQCSHEWSA